MKPTVEARRTSTLVSVATVVALALVWYIVTPTFVRDLVFPSPASVLEALHTLGWGLFSHAGVTLGRVMLGWAMGVPLGTVLGLALHRSPLLRAVVHPIVEAIRPLPAVAFIPFFILWFGLGTFGQVLLIALGCGLVLTVNTFTAVQTVPPVYVRAAISLGARPDDVYRTILLPAILPSLVGGARIAAALAFGLGTAAEFMGAQSGIGFLMMVARRTLNTNTILLGVLILGLESYGVDVVLRGFGRYLCRWTEDTADSLQPASHAPLQSPKRSL